MKPDLSHLDRYRIPHPADGPGADGMAIQIKKLCIIASWGSGWDHVSVSTVKRIPIYEEMEYVRSLFFDDDELVIQYSVPREKHIDNHPFCLHMWRPQDQEIPLPPGWMVGFK